MPSSDPSPLRPSVPLVATLLSALPEDPDLFLARLESVRATTGDAGLQRLFVESGYHGVSGVIDPHLVAATHLPEALRHQAARRLAAEEMWSAHLQHALEQAAQVLSEVRVAACALKGPLLGTRLYGPAATRHCMDIDLLVTPDAFESAVRALEAAGYVPEQAGLTTAYLRRYSHHLGFARPGHPPLELHFRAYAGLGVNVDAGFLIDRATAVRVGANAQVLVPSPEDEFVYLAAHAAGHSFCRLVWLYDLKLLLQHRAIDPGVVASRARDAGMLHAAAYASGLLREWFDTPDLLAGVAERGLRMRVADGLLASASRPQQRSARENLEGLVFSSMLCDRTTSTLWMLRHHLGRAVKRRAKQAAPQLLPDHWAS